MGIGGAVNAIPEAIILALGVLQISHVAIVHYRKRAGGAIRLPTTHIESEANDRGAGEKTSQRLLPPSLPRQVDDGEFIDAQNFWAGVRTSRLVFITVLILLLVLRCVTIWQDLELHAHDMFANVFLTAIWVSRTTSGKLAGAAVVNIIFSTRRSLS